MAVTASACSPVKVLNSLIPTDGHTTKSDIAYGSQPRQKLDMYIPSHSTASKQPVVIFFYGGSWESGEKKDYLFAAEAFVSRGYLTVVPNYRVYPQVAFPVVMQDPASVAKWVKENIAAFGGDPEHIFMVGHSAGAHLLTMLALNSDYLNQHSLNPTDFAGYIGLAGPYDFLPLQSKRLKEIFGSEVVQWESQPIHFVDGKNPAIMLLVGLKDTVVWPRNTFHLAAKIREHHGFVEVREFANYGHIEMVAKLAKPFRNNSRLLDEIDTFIQVQIKSRSNNI